MKKALALLLAFVLVIGATVAGTLAYLTSTDEVVNTFTVGNVQIKLDEAPVDANGKAIAGDRVQANNYKMLPGHTYDKDPMVTVLAPSESSYVRMFVTINKKAEIDAIDCLDWTKINIFGDLFTGMGAGWVYTSNTADVAANTQTFEFRYNQTVAATTANVELPDLFQGIAAPGDLTNEELATLDGFQITVTAEAIQADGFANADAAWAAFTK